jgi:hypothetical protein
VTESSFPLAQGTDHIGIITGGGAGTEYSSVPAGRTLCYSKQLQWSIVNEFCLIFWKEAMAAYLKALT